MSKENALVVVAQESGLEAPKIELLLGSYKSVFQKAKEIAEKANDIVVTDESQTDLMGKARAARLELKNLRVEAEKTRKQLKDQSLREGKAIDGMANIIKALIVPIEEHLEKQEKFAEVKAAERKAKRYSDRIEALSPYVENVSIYNLNDMEDEAFTILLEQSKKAHEAALKAQELAKAEQEAKEKAEEEERKRIREENQKLKEEAEAREKAELQRTQRINQLGTLGLIWDKDKAAYVKDDLSVAYADIIDFGDEEFDTLVFNIKEVLAQRKVEADKAAALKEEEARKEAEQKEEELRKEREAREEAEKLIAAEKAAAEKKAAEEAEAKRQALLAPDKEKLIAFAGVIDRLELPNVANREAGKLLDETQDFLNRISKNLRNKAKEL